MKVSDGEQIRVGGVRRPMLKTGLHRLRRGGGSVQIGADPDTAVLLTGLGESTDRWLATLDGLSDSDQLADRADAVGVDPQIAATLVDLLLAHGLLEDAASTCVGWGDLPLAERDRLAPDLASMTLLDPRPDGGKRVLQRRLACVVQVFGGGRVGSAVAELLGAAGVGRVRITDPRRVGPSDLGPTGWRPDDLGRRRGAKVIGSVPGLDRDADLIVLAFDGGIPAGPDQFPVPHLAAGVCQTTGVIGPLVVPGRTACLRCLDLARSDRDPDWTSLRRQLRSGDRSVVPSPACDAVLATLVAGHAALEILNFLDRGEASTMDGALHLRLPDGLLRRRSWAQHPACSCGWATAV
jgi:bacteriocin biosynthesis cyclodehydratase domain-containing protein